jgi:transposase
MLEALPKAKTLIGDRRYDAYWFRQALTARGTEPCIPSKTNRIAPSRTTRRSIASATRSRSLFGRLKDWRRIHTRYDRCAHAFMSAIALAATVIFWLPQRVLSLATL